MNTLNAETTIDLALRSVRSWVDEIVVVDMHSSDRTVEIARTFDAKIHLHEALGYVEPARRFAVDQATNEWILILDADELIPFPLSRRLLQAVRDDDADVLLLPTMNFIMGAPPLAHTGWGPMQDLHARFFRKASLEFSSTIHELLKPVPGARVKEIAYEDGLGIVHFNYLGTTDFINRLNRYTSIEARDGGKRRAGILRASWDALRAFLRRYVAKRGYRDGWRGFYLSSFMGFYELVAHAKRVESRKVGTEDDIANAYKKEAERMLGAYSDEA
jgi:glycosyltransferase involved in cell wall biosynthesis